MALNINPIGDRILVEPVEEKEGAKVGGSRQRPLRRSVKKAGSHCRDDRITDGSASRP